MKKALLIIFAVLIVVSFILTIFTWNRLTFPERGSLDQTVILNFDNSKFGNSDGDLYLVESPSDVVKFSVRYGRYFPMIDTRFYLDVELSRKDGTPIYNGDISGLYVTLPEQENIYNYKATFYTQSNGLTNSTVILENVALTGTFYVEFSSEAFGQTSPQGSVFAFVNDFDNVSAISSNYDYNLIANVVGGTFETLSYSRPEIFDGSYEIGDILSGFADVFIVYPSWTLNHVILPIYFLGGDFS